jgi:hypothetical protein
VTVQLTGKFPGTYAVVQPAPACLTNGIAGGTSCPFSVVFTPKGVGSEDETMGITATPGGSSATFALPGQG